MPKECIDCRFITVDNDAVNCERCGGERLRFSMLAGMKFRERKDEAAKAKVGENERPGPFDRIYQGARFLIASQTAMIIVLGAAIFSTPDDQVPKSQALAGMLASVNEAYPFIALIGAIAIPALAAGAGVVFALRGVYLAQQMGLVLGPISAFISLSLVAALGGSTHVFAWLLSPPLAGFLAFLAGLRMTGFIREKESEAKTVQYKPIDSWEREAKPRFLDLRFARQGYHRKLSIGILAGGLTSYFFPFLLAAMSGATSHELAFARTVFGWGGVCVAGAFAAAGTNAPILQGCLAGFLMYFVRHYSHIHIVNPEMVLTANLHILAGFAGGHLGAAFFPPARVVRGRIRAKSDGIVYVGDELAKNPT
jgi:hypothetical protein